MQKNILTTKYIEDLVDVTKTENQNLIHESFEFANFLHKKISNQSKQFYLATPYIALEDMHFVINPKIDNCMQGFSFCFEKECFASSKLLFYYVEMPVPKALEYFGKKSNLLLEKVDRCDPCKIIISKPIVELMPDRFLAELLKLKPNTKKRDSK